MIENLLLVMALVWATVIFVWVVFMLIAEYSAVTYVPSAVKPVIEILKRQGLNEKKIFWDLGSGDGRIVKAVAREFGCQAVGFEINPLLVAWSIIGTNTRVEWKSLWKADFSLPDFIYCYLSPRAMKKVGEKFLSDGKKGAVLISKAFAAPNLKSRLIQEAAAGEKRYYVYEK